MTLSWPGEDRWLSGAAVMLGAVGLGYALQLSNGTLQPEALRWLLATMALSTVAVAALKLAPIEALEDGPAAALGLAGAVVFIGIHLTTPPGVYLRVPGEAYVVHHQWVAGAAVAIGLCFTTARTGLGRLGVPLAVVCFLALGVWLLKASPNPTIDVFVWHQASYNALAEGHSPYGISIPNIYANTQWYAPGTADISRVYIGYVYPPLSLLLGAPGHLLAGDYRYANLGALALSGCFIAYAKPSRLSAVAAALFLFQPRMLFVLEQGWTEATALFMFTGTVFVACRFPRALPYAIGALMATKQYFVLVAPLALFLLPQPLTRKALLPVVAKAVGVGLVLTLPLALTDLPGFYKSVIQFQGLQPFRADALSLMAATAEGGVPRIPMWGSFAALLVGLAIAWARAPRTPAGFAMGSALVYVLFFGVAKQAFCNYYFLVVGLLFTAVALLEPKGVLEARDA